MINGIQVKICGITSLIDAEAADRIGADYLGFILWPKSPRHVTLETFRVIAELLPFRKKVAVMVEPAETELRNALASGFSLAQIHFRHTTPLAQIKEWSRIVGAQHLWLAPKLPPEIAVPSEWLPLADGILMDTFRPDPDSYGATGEAGDWQKFARHRTAHPDNLWILAGGLNPDNVGKAVNESGAHFVDVSSGVETSPGVKSMAKLEAFARGLKQH